MLRVGLTGGLGSGKTTVAGIFRALGAPVMQADEVARELMQPGGAVYHAIVESFGPGVLAPDGALDRRKLASLAFGGGRLEELNALVHPPVIARQQEWMDEIAREQPEAVAVYETALLFEASRRPGEREWKDRFDWRILVTAPEAVRIARYVARAGGGDAGADARRMLEEEARRRIRAQMPDEEKRQFCESVLVNDGSLEELTRQTQALYRQLCERAREPGGAASTTGRRRAESA
jgi:dephospho-CoA kinase